MQVAPDIKGYRQLSDEELALINDIKDKAEEVGQLVSQVMCNVDTDKRWMAEARTDLQKGFMSLVRSVARPENF